MGLPRRRDLRRVIDWSSIMEWRAVNLFTISTFMSLEEGNSTGPRANALYFMLVVLSTEPRFMYYDVRTFCTIYSCNIPYKTIPNNTILDTNVCSIVVYTVNALLYFFFIFHYLPSIILLS